MIKVLRVSDGDIRLSPNFRSYEFRCKDDSDLILIADELLERLQTLRDMLGKPININSAYRTLSHNSKPTVGGQRRSPHMAGLAADIKCPDVSPAEVAKAAESVGFRGIGLYDTFVHVDVAARRSCWDKRGNDLRYVKTFGGIVPLEVDYKALYENAAGQLTTVKAALETLARNLEV